MKRKLIIDDTRRYVESGDIVAAILRSAGDLELILFEKLFFEKGISAELMEKWMLGIFIRWNITLGLIDKKWQQTLKEFKDLRNLLAHERGFDKRLKTDKKLLNYANGLVISVCDLIDETEVRYLSNDKVEREYADYFKKPRKQIERLIKLARSERV